MVEELGLFQSTRPRGARRRGGARRSNTSCRFNPRARVGRDDGSGARKTPWRCFNPRARVGRDDFATLPKLSAKFQSTRPRGARRLHHVDCVHDVVVSIHAPAWGATFNVLYGLTIVCSFNPRARAGRDPLSSWHAALSLMFQSTRPRGARRFSPSCSSSASGFQSTRPRGARRVVPPEFEGFMLFQSTRPRGARPAAA